MIRNLVMGAITFNTKSNTARGDIGDINLGIFLILDLIVS